MSRFNKNNPDERESSGRKYHLDYEALPGLDKNKRTSYVYTGYYYAPDFVGSKFNLKSFKLIAGIVSIVQLVGLIGAGLLDCVLNHVTRMIFPYIFGILGAGMSAMGVMELLGCKEEFTRRVRDKGTRRILFGQMILFASAVILVVATTVYLFIGSGAPWHYDLIFALCNVIFALSSAWMFMFMRAHPVKIVRDGREEYDRIVSEMREKEEASAAQETGSEEKDE